ncbi:phage tail tape measure protein [Octadecabacter sp. 1_MG-2023]|uniref:phage tail tape measure protein n=1 Tax=unclassified Octadecabacter TaxID=196158 RepID=UPI001C08DDC1|nr:MULTISPECIES: phage tail tape measure protein [unclassified Octadecabacter]MBU2993699.1 phage tail tape measure protein [Octadecabacter sp. B2R22]MDO6735457.1 phage tail tape measure protein [Octadecabacter sp. 1_MG-2023]
MDDIDGLDALESEAKALETTLGSVTVMTDAFEGQLSRMKATLGDTTRDLGNLERGFSGGLRKAFDGLVFDGNSLSDALATVGQAMSRTVYNNAISPVTDHFGGILAGGVNSLVSSLMPFEKGGAISQGRVTPFAKGGVVSGATTFPMRGGTGLMGEAGPEAIMPLTRGADGSLGVKAQGGQAVNVTMNISTPDAAGFQRSQSQIAASLGRALGRGQRNR